MFIVNGVSGSSLHCINFGAATDFACGTGGFLTSWLKELSTKIVTTEDQVAYDTSIYGIEKKQFPYMLCITNMLLHGIDVPKIYHDNSLLKDVLDYTESDQFDVILMNPPYGGNEKMEVKNHFPADLASSETADLFMSVIMYRLKKNGRAAVILPDGFLFGTDNAKVAIKKKLFSEFNLHTVIRLPHALGIVFSVIDRRYRSGRPLIVTTNLPIKQLKEETNIEKKRIYDRILEMCVPLYVGGSSYRSDIAHEKMGKMKTFFATAESSQTENIIEQTGTKTI